jgi:hypothetical protein
MEGPLAIARAELSRRAAATPGGDRYAIDVFLENRGDAPVEGYRLEARADGKLVGSSAGPRSAALGPRARSREAAVVVLDGLDGPGPGGFEDSPPWLARGLDVELLVIVTRHQPVFMISFDLPAAFDRRMLRLILPRSV